MKAGIHPEYKETTIKCACGNVIETGSTKENVSIEICSACHPFYTGKQKLVDTGGRVDKFRKRFGLDEGKQFSSYRITFFQEMSFMDIPNKFKLKILHQKQPDKMSGCFIFVSVQDEYWQAKIHIFTYDYSYIQAFCGGNFMSCNCMAKLV